MTLIGTMSKYDGGLFHCPVVCVSRYYL